MADAFLTRKGGENVTPEVTQQESIIQNITEALVGKVYGANATPETILKGYSAYVHQELVEGALEPGVDLLAATGYTKLAVDKFILSTTTKAYDKPVSHSLGESPKMMLLLSDVATPSSHVIDDISGFYGIPYSTTASWVGVNYYTGAKTWAAKSVAFLIDAETIKARDSNETLCYAAGVKYTLITMA